MLSYFLSKLTVDVCLTQGSSNPGTPYDYEWLSNCPVAFIKVSITAWGRYVDSDQLFASLFLHSQLFLKVAQYIDLVRLLSDGVLSCWSQVLCFLSLTPSFYL